ncbi:MAG: beta-lactamase family protein [Clostridia bacterium]|nr:beta-lactamase family protein [Clostridia bacterium]
MTLQEGMHFLINESRMLTGLSVTYGRSNCAETTCIGNMREWVPDNDTFVLSPSPIVPDSVFDLASLTKCFTAVLAMLLIREKRLDPDAPAGLYDARFVHLRSVPMMDILTFRTGLTTPGRIDNAPSAEEGLKRLFETAPAAAPRISLYSDIPAMITARILESITGKSYMTLLEERILKPLGMTETGNRPAPGRCLDYGYEYRLIDGNWQVQKGRLGQIHDPKAALLQPAAVDCCGHAGLFSTQSDMQRFAQGLLGGELLTLDELRYMGENRTGMPYGDGTHRQYLGILCFSKHPNQRLSEMPVWMGSHTVGLSGFTGNHLAIDPDSGTFILYLGNRVHHRLTRIVPQTDETFSSLGLAPDGTGTLPGPDGRPVHSSVRFVYFKDQCLGNPIGKQMRRLGWLPQEA